jgi:hypothetical protein
MSLTRLLVTLFILFIPFLSYQTIPKGYAYAYSDFNSGIISTPTARTIKKVTLPIPTHMEPCRLVRYLVLEWSGSLSKAKYFEWIARKESGCRPTAKGYAGPYYGLFQIHVNTWRGLGCTGSMKNAIDNTRCAFKKVLPAQGYGAWQVTTVYKYPH